MKSLVLSIFLALVTLYIARGSRREFEEAQFVKKQVQEQIDFVLENKVYRCTKLYSKKEE